MIQIARSLPARRDLEHMLWCGAGAFGGAGTAVVARRKNAGGGGPSSPSYVGAGAGSVATAGTQSVAYPASLANNDLLLLSATAHVGTVSTPAGFTATYAGFSNLVSETGYLFTKRSDGTETGSITLTSSSTFTVARMYAIRNVALSSFIEDSETLTNNSGPGGLSSLDTFRLAAAFQGGYGSSPDVIAGASGGTWVLTASYRDASTTMCCSLDLIAAPSATTISGGASTSYGEVTGKAIMLVHA